MRKKIKSVFCSNIFPSKGFFDDQRCFASAFKTEEGILLKLKVCCKQSHQVNVDHCNINSFFFWTNFVQGVHHKPKIINKWIWSSIVNLAREMTTFNPPFFSLPLHWPLLTPKEVKAPTFLGSQVLTGVKIGNFPATLWKREWN